MCIRCGLREPMCIKCGLRGPMCIRCQMFILSGPSKLLFLFYCLLDMSCGECNVISLYVCFALAMDLYVSCVSDSVCELFDFRNIFRCGYYFVAGCYGVGERVGRFSVG